MKFWVTLEARVESSSTGERAAAREGGRRSRRLHRLRTARSTRLTGGRRSHEVRVCGADLLSQVRGVGAGEVGSAREDAKARSAWDRARRRDDRRRDAGW